MGLTYGCKGHSDCAGATFLLTLTQEMRTSCAKHREENIDVLLDIAADAGTDATVHVTLLG